MDVTELVLTRRTVHNYRPEPVADAVVETALRLSLWAPNHKLTYPWVYTLIAGSARKRLADLAGELRLAKNPAASETQLSAAKSSVLNPSHLVSLGLKRSDERQMHEDFATLAAGVQIMAIYLWHQGVCTKWSTAEFTTHPKAYDILGLDPKTVKLEGCLMIGKPDGLPPAPERPDLKEFLRRIE